MTNHSHRLSPTASIGYIQGGHGTFTLVGKTNRFTFNLGKSDDSPIFVRVLDNPDNTSDGAYIGFINRNLELVAGRKGKPDAPSFKALSWYLAAWKRDSELAAKAEFWHEGTCSVCGRKLTTPESIERGIGPKCLERA